MKCYYYYYYYYYYFWLTGELYKLGINKFVTTQRSIVKGQKAFYHKRWFYKIYKGSTIIRSHFSQCISTLIGVMVHVLYPLIRDSF